VDQRAAGAATLKIAFPPGALASVTIGASVAINGTCLTVS
jgi:riboflavin synthase alpha subunit